ncbi:MAG: hypothetical protein CMF55_01490 [Legionellales bacterium]|nr:hypothetical protein [Legionellales bacterium]
MKFNKKNILPIVLATTLGCSVTCAFAHNAKGNQAQSKPCQSLKKQSYSDSKTRYLKQLNLSPEQQSNIQSVIDNAQHEAKPLRRDLQKSKFEFKQAITADHYEQKTIDELAKRQGDDITQLLRLKGKTQQAIKNVLNDQQRSTLERMQERHLRLITDMR